MKLPLVGHSWTLGSKLLGYLHQLLMRRNVFFFESMSQIQVKPAVLSLPDRLYREECVVLESSSETQGQIVGARESLNRWKNMAQSKERPEEPLRTMSYQTSSKRSPPFWLLIGARKLVFHLVVTFPRPHYLPLGLRGCVRI